MSNHLSSEIGRMRSEQMIARGLRNQQISRLEREREMASQPVRASHRHGATRVLQLATLFALTASSLDLWS